MNRKYHPQTEEFILKNYDTLSNAELASILGIDTPEKVRELARRLRVKWRAENGAPKWRPSKPRNHMPRLAA